MRVINLRMIVSSMFFAAVLSTLAYPEIDATATDNCASMLNLQIANTTITSAQIVPAANGLPRYCNVIGVIAPTVGFEVRMPPDWNGKMYFHGGGGFGGHIGQNVSLGLSRHYATAETDSGHQDPDIFDASWALNNRPAEIEFGYLAVHVSTMVAKIVIQNYYDSLPRQSYFDGCSNGGRQGMQEAERYPGDFDGIIAGAPDVDFTGLMMNFNWDMQVQHATPNRTDITVEKLPLIGNAVLAACDGIDGLIDGQIDDPRKCKFDPGVLQCKAGNGPDCLTSVQVDALRKIWDGPRTSTGKRVNPGFARGAETPIAEFFPSQGGWDIWLVNTPGAPSRGFKFQDQFFRYLAFKVDDPNFDWSTFNFDTDPQRTGFMARILNTTHRSLSPFEQQGGKLLIYQGWADFAMSPLRQIEYFESVQREFGIERTNSFARMFMAPGMYHCLGGPGPNQFDYLTAMEQWVEHGSAPDSMLASHFDANGNLDRTRPLCAYPKVARYDGVGNINDAASFSCADPVEDSSPSQP